MVAERAVHLAVMRAGLTAGVLAAPTVAVMVWRLVDM